MCDKVFSKTRAYYLKKCVLYIVIFLSVFVKEVSSSAVVSGSGDASPLVEEGWRYSVGGLGVRVFSSELEGGRQDLDLNLLHQSLAIMGQEASESTVSFGETTSATSIFRFTPVLVDRGTARLEKSVKITDAIFTYGRALIVMDILLMKQYL